MHRDNRKVVDTSRFDDLKFPDRKKKKRGSKAQGLSEARRIMRKDLSWLEGYPIHTESNAVLWQTLASKAFGKARRLTLQRDDLVNALKSVERLYNHFPRALPKLVVDRDVWYQESRAALLAVETAMDKGYLPESPFSNLPAESTPRFEGPDKRDLAPLVSAVSWFAARDPDLLGRCLELIGRKRDVLAGWISLYSGSPDCLRFLCSALKLAASPNCSQPTAILALLDYKEVKTSITTAEYQALHDGTAHVGHEREPGAVKQLWKLVEQVAELDERQQNSFAELLVHVDLGQHCQLWEHWWDRVQNLKRDSKRQGKFNALKREQPQPLSKYTFENLAKVSMFGIGTRRALKDLLQICSANDVAIDTQTALVEQASALRNSYQFLGGQPAEQKLQKYLKLFSREVERYAHENQLNSLLIDSERLFQRLGQEFHYLDAKRGPECVEGVFELAPERERLKLSLSDLVYVVSYCAENSAVYTEEIREFAPHMSMVEVVRYGLLPLLRLVRDRVGAANTALVANKIFKTFSQEGFRSFSFSNVLQQIPEFVKDEILVPELIDGSVGGVVALLDTHDRLSKDLGGFRYFERFKSVSATEGASLISAMPDGLRTDAARLLSLPGGAAALESLIDTHFPSAERFLQERNKLEQLLPTVKDPQRCLNIEKRITNLKDPTRLLHLRRKAIRQLPRKIERRRRKLFIDSWHNDLAEHQNSAVCAEFPEAEELLKDAKVRLALFQALSLKKSSRPAIARFVAACNVGGTHDFLTLDANLDFISQLERKGICSEAWLDPERRMKGRLNGVGPVTLEFERRPLEALFMGGHFKTCLSPGEFNYFAVFSNILDVNKQILYARNREGTVVARRLFAITDVGHIVTFYPYAHGDGKGFRELSDTFAAELAREMRTVVADSGSVSRLVSKEWYDDGIDSTPTSFPWAEAKSALREALKTATPQSVVGLLEQALAPQGLNAVSLPAVLELGELTERPGLLVPLAPFVTAEARLPKHCLGGYFKHLLDSELAEDELRPLIVRFLNSLAKGEYPSDADQSSVARIAEIYPSMVLRMIKRAVKTEEDLRPRYQNIESQILVRLGRQPAPAIDISPECVR